MNPPFEVVSENDEELLIHGYPSPFYKAKGLSLRLQVTSLKAIVGSSVPRYPNTVPSALPDESVTLPEVSFTLTGKATLKDRCVLLGVEHHETRVFTVDFVVPSTEKRRSAVAFAREKNRPEPRETAAVIHFQAAAEGDEDLWVVEFWIKKDLFDALLDAVQRNTLSALGVRLFADDLFISDPWHPEDADWYLRPLSRDSAESVAAISEIAATIGEINLGSTGASVPLGDSIGTEGLNAAQLILDSYRECSPTKDGQLETWINLAASRIGERLHCQSQDDPKGSFFRAQCREVGFALVEFSEPAGHHLKEVTDLLSAKDINPTVLGGADLVHGLPDAEAYLVTRVLFANHRRSASASLERHWQHLSSLIRSDEVLRRNFAILTCRHAALERADSHLRAIGSLSTACLAAASRQMAMKNVLVLSFAALAAAALAWYLSQTSSIAIALVPATLLLGGVLAVLWIDANGHTDRSREARRDLKPLMELEAALERSETEADLVRCSDFAHELFCKGYIEAMHIANVLRSPDVGR